MLVRGARSSFIHRVPNGARNRSGSLSPPAAQDVAPCARSPAGTARATAAAELSTAQLASVVTRGRGWQRALRGSRPTPARRRLGALRESRGSPDLPKVAGTSIRRARAHGNRPGSASGAGLRNGGTAGSDAAEDRGGGGVAPRGATFHPASSARSLQGRNLAPADSLLSRTLLSFPGREVLLLDLLGSAYLVPLNSDLLGRDTRNRGRGFARVHLCAGGFSSQPACPPVPSSANGRSQIL